MNKLAIVVDHYLEITGQDDGNYKRHLRPARDLLTLCDEDPERAKGVLDRMNIKMIGLEWSMHQAVKNFLEVNH